MIQRKRFRMLFPREQRRLVLLVLFGSGMSVIMSVCIGARSLSNVAKNLPNDGDRVMEQIPNLLLGDMLLALAVAVPAFAMLTFAISMPYFGVLHRLHTFVAKTASGEQIEPCSLRGSDPMQASCELLNQATEGQRALNGGQVSPESSIEPSIEEAA